MAELLGRIDQQQIASGIFPDEPGAAAPLWIDGQNITFLENYVRPFFGGAIIGDTLEGYPVTDFSMVRRSSVPTGYVAASKHLFSFTDPSTMGVPTPVGGPYTASGNWVLAPWGDWMLATNNLDHVQVDKGVGFVDLDTDGVFTTAKIMLNVDPYAFAFNTSAASGRGNDILWSTNDDPETWTPAATNLAGDTQIRDIISEITCAKMLGDRAIVYNQDDQYILSFIGPPFIWGLSNGVLEIGAVGPHAVTAVGNVHYGFGKRGLWVSDAVTHRYFDPPAVRDYIYSDINLSATDLVCVAHFKQEFSVGFFWPSASSSYPDKGVFFNYRTNTFCPAGFGLTAVQSASQWNFDIGGDKNGVLFQLGLDSAAMQVPTFGWGGTPVNASHPSGYGWGEGGWGGYDDGGAESYATLTSKPLSFGKQDQEKVIDSVIVEIDGTPSANSTVEIGTLDYLNGTTTWGTAQSFPGSNQPIYFDRPRGFFIQIRIIDPNPATKWKLSGIEFYGRLGAKRR